MSRKVADKHIHRVSHFRTRDELLRSLPQVEKLQGIFNLFAASGTAGSMESSNICDCLRAMGLLFQQSRLHNSMSQRLKKFPQGKTPRRVSFELLLTLYCELADQSDVPTAATMIDGLRCCDVEGRGVLPYTQLRNILTTVGDCLNEEEVYDLLFDLTDSNGNVNYVTLMESLLTRDGDAHAKVHQARIYLEALGNNCCHMDMQKRDDFIKTLRELDVAKTGFIGGDRLLALLNGSGDAFTSTELTALTSGMLNPDRQVDYRKFLRLIMND
ncbi:CG34435 [Drosophila busckii]|uniref:CG34435 n=1 Tax=Drosophila busckii TaxID=30019 RepID=A0A0M4EU19_DROBS|nr:myosin light chain 3, skeletal muscle isoform [Drosophila busckii]ALC48497.1 CG34435 [Drosophila busckii]